MILSLQRYTLELPIIAYGLAEMEKFTYLYTDEYIYKKQKQNR